MIPTLVSAAAIVWAGVVIGVALAVGRAMRLADEAMERLTEYAQDADGRPLNSYQMLYVPAEWAVQS
jgi:hypothetical protein